MKEIILKENEKMELGKVEEHKLSYSKGMINIIHPNGAYSGFALDYLSSNPPDHCLGEVVGGLFCYLKKLGYEVENGKLFNSKGKEVMSANNGS